jgi:hypothetical protein
MTEINNHHKKDDDDDDDNAPLPLVNFRPVLPGRNSNLYRSSAPEAVMTHVRKSSGCSNGNVPEEGTMEEQFILKEANLILDLRSYNEGDSASKEELVTQAPGGAFHLLVMDQTPFPEQFDRSQRYMVRMDLLGDRKQFLQFIDTNWPQPKELDGLDDQAILMKRRSSISSRGLAGMNQLLLERKVSIRNILKLITQFLEQVPDAKMLIHCTAGKDRTGMICMLLQSVAGFSDEEIITEYTISEIEAKDIMAKALQRHANPLIDPDIMSGANKEGMEGALFHLRSTYGSVDNYLEDIGFDDSWRVRLQQVMVNTK